MADEMRLEGSEEDGFLLQFSSEGVFLTVYPLTAINIETVTKVLDEYQVKNYDTGEILRIITSATGTPELIADNYIDPGTLDIYSGEELKDEYAKISVEVSKDRMTATVHYDTTRGTRLPTVEMIHEALAEKRVVYGINEDAISEGVKSATYFVAAEGTPPVHGENARIERKFDLGDKGKPVIGNYDKADYKNLNLFVLAKRNQILAVRIPHTEGIPGKNVYGDDVPAKNGRPVPMPVGKIQRLSKRINLLRQSTVR